VDIRNKHSIDPSLFLSFLTKIKREREVYIGGKEDKEG